GGLIGRLIVAEGLLLGLLGGLAGAAAAHLFMRASLLSLSVEGLTMTISTTPAIVLIGLAISAALGVLAGIVPAIQASRREIAQCFRAVCPDGRHGWPLWAGRAPPLRLSSLCGSPRHGRPRAASRGARDSPVPFRCAHDPPPLPIRRPQPR